ncbi:hypothetical protein ACHHYP_16663 [Achlya hypogyna]|uniref:Secreted protein n=1 Tax=Achlya hypogyna TaxID=1202772 RepID=A0A0A7CPM2_ACHHY|nr:secreted protein [Achlya hypogyna]OQR81211.1 hypothetical protein ACHHYP_16663 [Achlya hypogyna]
MKLTTTLALATVAAGQTCTKLSDPSSPIAASLKMLAGDDAEDAIAAVAAALPDSASTCLGSIDPTAAISALTAALGTETTCIAASTWFLGAVKDMKGVMAPTTSAPSANSSFSLPAYATFTDAQAAAVCTPVTTSLLPCYNKALVPAVTKLLSAMPCCADMLKEVETNFGQSLSNMLTDLVNKIVDVGCAVQTPGFSAANQTCAYSLTKSFTANIKSYEGLLKNGLAIVQIPNDQGCAAAEGNPFKTTGGVTVSDVYTKPVVPGACAKPVDALITYISGYPILKKAAIANITVSDLFTDGKCVKGTSVKGALAAIKMKPDVKAAVDAILTDDVCFHIANGFSATCKTVSSLSSTSSTPSGTSSTTAAPGAAKSSATSLSAMVSVVGMAAVALAF